MDRFPLSAAGWMLGVVFVTATSAQTLPSFEKAAEKIQATTVTIRAGSRKDGQDSKQVDRDESLQNVTVFSGCLLGRGLVVAPLPTDGKADFRITLSGGGQAQARGRVFDEPSGLALLEIEDRKRPGVELAAEVPKVGSWVISASGWGVEQPVVSFGMVSGIDRRLPGSTYPPLLQCNLSSTKTSSGSPVVNQHGKLLGIIVGVDASQDSRGWVYAVPTQHVRRLVRLYDEKFSDKLKSNEREAIFIPWRRPVVGMQIDGNVDQVVVRRVTAGGPADRSGIRKGDQIVAVDGVKIRSVYQAIGPTLFKQPGDTVSFLVKRDGQPQEVEVTLGGTLPVGADERNKLSQLIGPKIQISRLALENSLQRNRQGSVRELADGEDDVTSTEMDQLKLLETAVRRYHNVIERQQEHIRALEKEIGTLKKQFGKEKPAK